MENTQEKWRVDLYIETMDGPTWVPALYQLAPGMTCFKPQYVGSEAEAQQVVRFLRADVKHSLPDSIVRYVRVND